MMDYEQRAREIVTRFRDSHEIIIAPRSAPRVIDAIAAALREADDTARRETAAQMVKEYFALAEPLRARLDTTLARLAAAQAEAARLREALRKVADFGDSQKYWDAYNVARAALAPRAAGGEGTAG